MLQLATVFLGFILTGIIGNFLVQKWQHQNWINQQRILRANSNLGELKNLIDSITHYADTRNYRARKLSKAINNADAELLLTLRNEYEVAVTAWNDQWNSFCIGLTLYADHRFTLRLEESIQARFFRVGLTITEFLRAPGEITARKRALLDRDLNILSGQIFNFSRDLLNVFLANQEDAYSLKKIEFNETNLVILPTWKLFKALFKPLEAC